MKKAKEYAEKYGMALSSMHHLNLSTAKPEEIKQADETVTTALQEIFHDFCEEFKELCKKRNARTFSSRQDVARELNDKWNAVGRAMEKIYGIPVVQPNAFMADFRIGRVRAY